MLNWWQLAVWLASTSRGGGLMFVGLRFGSDGLRFGSVGFGWFCAFCGLGQWLIMVWINGFWLIFRVFWFVAILGDGWSLIMGLVVCCESCYV